MLSLQQFCIRLYTAFSFSYTFVYMQKAIYYRIYSSSQPVATGVRGKHGLAVENQYLFIKFEQLAIAIRFF